MPGRVGTKSTAQQARVSPLKTKKIKKGSGIEGQVMEIGAFFQEILKTEVKRRRRVRSPVADSLIYLDAKRDGTVITPLHLRRRDAASIL